jgi:hypothetical protein
MRRLIMNNKLFNIILFTAGVAIGSSVTWKIVKTKYERIAQEEIDSVKAEYVGLMKKMKNKLHGDSTYEEDNQNDADESEEDVEVEDPRIVERRVIRTEYNRLTNIYSSSEDKNDEEGGNGALDDDPYISGPYVITPEDFRCSPPGYNAQALDYFADGVLADSWGVELSIEDTIGEEALDHFGDDVDDLVYVRNEQKEVDYEVSRDPREYHEAYPSKSGPYYD